MTGRAIRASRPNIERRTCVCRISTFEQSKLLLLKRECRVPSEFRRIALPSAPCPKTYRVLGKNCLPTATGRRPPLVRGTRNVVCLVENLALSLLNALYLVAICARRPHRLGGVGVATRRAPIADYHRRSRMAPVSATGLRTVRSSVTRALTQGHATARRRRRYTQRRGKRARVANNAPSDRSSAVESF